MLDPAKGTPNMEHDPILKSWTRCSRVLGLPIVLGRVALAISVLYVFALDGAHAHDGPTSCHVACSVCQLADGIVPMATVAKALPILGTFRAPAPPGYQLSPRIADLASRHIRAPPLNVLPLHG